jgi:hypothetical protein
MLHNLAKIQIVGFFAPEDGVGLDPSVDAYLPYHITHSPDDVCLESDGGKIMTRENRRTRRKTCPSTTLSTTNPTWIDQGLGGKRPATNDLSNGTAHGFVLT